jgi:hypothetical protein
MCLEKDTLKTKVAEKDGFIPKKLLFDTNLGSN